MALLFRNQPATLLFGPRDPGPALRLNALLLSRVAEGAPHRELAATRVGSLVHCRRLELLVLKAIQDGADPQQPVFLESLAWQIARFGLAGSEAGDSAEAQRKGLREWLEAFHQQGLPKLRALGVVELPPGA